MSLKIFLFCLGAILHLKVEALIQRHPHGEPTPLLRVTRVGDNEKFEGNLEVINRIFSHPLVKDRKIVVFSIVGPSRHGKLFFLDYCLRYLYATYPSVNTLSEIPFMPNPEWLGDRDEELTGFSWAHRSTAHTKGMVIWSDVFLHDRSDGEKIAIVVIDTRGLFELQSTEEENLKRFSLNSILSSIQIINTIERNGENRISNLDTVINLSKLINEQETAQWKAFQNLLFLVRDLEDGEFSFGYEGGKRYFKTSLDRTSNAKLVWERMNNSFDEISCFLLNFPGNAVKKSRFQGEWSKLDEEFVENLKTLIESLLSPERLVIKSVFGREILASEYQKLTISYFDAYQKFKTLQASNIFNVSIDNEMQSVVDEKTRKFS